MANNNDVEGVRRFLSSKCISLPATNGWLIGCIEWYKSEHTQCSLTDLQQFAYQQWLLADLSIINHGCLPPNISQNRCTTLNGKYSLQVNYFFNVGESVYNQYQRLNLAESIVNDDDKWKAYWMPKPTRMIKMEMTDGIQNVIGMEYAPISSINSSMAPGTKVIVKGPVECRNGVLMLKNNNIDVLGGEVDTLFEDNCMTRLIARKLDLDENNIIQRAPSSPVANNVDIQQQGLNNQVTAQRNHHQTRQQLQTNNEADFFDSDDEVVFLNVPAEVDPSSSKQIACQNNINNNNNHRIPVNSDNADDFLSCDDDDILLGDIEIEALNESNPLPSSSLSLPASINKPQVIPKAGVKRPAESVFPESTHSNSATNRISQVKRLTKYPNNSESLRGTNKSNFSSAIPQTQQKIDNFIRRGSSSTEDTCGNRDFNLKETESNLRYEILPEKPGVNKIRSGSTLTNSKVSNSNRVISESRRIDTKVNSDSLHHSSSITGTTEKLTAQVKKFMSKLLINGENWSLSVCLSAADRSINATFDPDLLNRIIGFSPVELKSKQKEMAVNSAIKEKMDQMLRRGQQVIKCLNCDMILETQGCDKPQVIISISDKSAFADINIS